MAAATENVTALDSMPNGGMAAANQPQAASATNTTPAAAACLGEVKILVFAPLSRR
jgi:hypothetical protein